VYSVESFCRFEVRAHVEKGFLLKSFALIDALINVRSHFKPTETFRCTHFTGTGIILRPQQRRARDHLRACTVLLGCPAEKSSGVENGF